MITGDVDYIFGSYRVNGILAMSRAIGDFELAPSVICTPDVTERRLQKQDSFLIVATDGIWDTVLDEEASKIVLRIVTELESKGIATKDALKAAAEYLENTAMIGGSTDNIACIVVSNDTSFGATTL